MNICARGAGAETTVPFRRIGATLVAQATDGARELAFLIWALVGLSVLILLGTAVYWFLTRPSRVDRWKTSSGNGTVRANSEESAPGPPRSPDEILGAPKALSTSSVEPVDSATEKTGLVAAATDTDVASEQHSESTSSQHRESADTGTTSNATETANTETSSTETSGTETSSTGHDTRSSSNVGAVNTTDSVTSVGIHKSSRPAKSGSKPSNDLFDRLSDVPDIDPDGPDSPLH